MVEKMATALDIVLRNLQSERSERKMVESRVDTGDYNVREGSELREQIVDKLKRNTFTETQEGISNGNQNPNLSLNDLLVQEKHKRACKVIELGREYQECHRRSFNGEKGFGGGEVVVTAKSKFEKDCDRYMKYVKDFLGQGLQLDVGCLKNSTYNCDLQYFFAYVDDLTKSGGTKCTEFVHSSKIDLDDYHNFKVLCKPDYGKGSSNGNTPNSDLTFNSACFQKPVGEESESEAER